MPRRMRCRVILEKKFSTASSQHAAVGLTPMLRAPAAPDADLPRRGQSVPARYVCAAGFGRPRLPPAARALPRSIPRIPAVPWPPSPRQSRCAFEGRPRPVDRSPAARIVAVPKAGVAEWQTRQTQNLLSERTWEFKSPRPHQLSQALTTRLLLNHHTASFFGRANRRQRELFRVAPSLKRPAEAPLPYPSIPSHPPLPRVRARA